MDVAVVERIDVAEVGHADARGEVLLVGLGEGAAVEPMRRAASSSPCSARAASPRSSSQVRVASTSWRSSTASSTDGIDSPAGHPDDEVQPGQHGLGDPGGVVDRRARKACRRMDSIFSRTVGVVAVARDVDQAGHEAAEAVPAQEQLGLAALLQVQAPTVALS